MRINVGILLTEPLTTLFSEIFIEIIYTFIRENASEVVVCEIVAIFLGLNALTRKVWNHFEEK